MFSESKKVGWNSWKKLEKRLFTQSGAILTCVKHHYDSSLLEWIQCCTLVVQNVAICSPLVLTNTSVNKKYQKKRFSTWWVVFIYIVVQNFNKNKLILILQNHSIQVSIIFNGSPYSSWLIWNAWKMPELCLKLETFYFEVKQIICDTKTKFVRLHTLSPHLSPKYSSVFLSVLLSLLTTLYCYYHLSSVSIIRENRKGHLCHVNLSSGDQQYDRRVASKKM